VLAAITVGASTAVAAPTPPGPAWPLPEDLDRPAAVAAWLDACAAALPPRAIGLAHVAEHCQGVDWVLAHGMLADALASDWPEAVDATDLRTLAALARVAYDAATPAPRLTHEKVAAVLADLHTAPPVGWSALQRWLDALDRLLARGEQKPRDSWLDRLLADTRFPANTGRWVERVLYVLLFVLAGAVVVREVRARGRRRTPRGAVPTRAESRSNAPPSGLRERLAAEFQAHVRALAGAGVIERPEAVTCRELVRLGAATPGGPLAPLATVAPVVERATYSRAPPEPDELRAALAVLRTAGTPR
jgi:hypothetical protein